MRVIEVNTLRAILDEAELDDEVLERILDAVKANTQEAYTLDDVKAMLSYERKLWEEIKKDLPEIDSAEFRIREIDLLLNCCQSLLQRSEQGVLV